MHRRSVTAPAVVCLGQGILKVTERVQTNNVSKYRAEQTRESRVEDTICAGDRSREKLRDHLTWHLNPDLNRRSRCLLGLQR